MPRKPKVKAPTLPLENSQLIRLVEELADANRRLLNREHELRRKQFYQDIYNRIVTRLIQPGDIDASLADVLEILCGSSDSEIGAIFVYAPEEKRLLPVAGFNLPAPLPTFELGEGLPGSVAREKKKLVSGDIPDTFPFKIRKTRDVDISPRVIVLQPLHNVDQLMGLLFLGSSGNYSAESLELLDRCGVQMAVAMVGALTLRRAVHLARELKFKSEALKKKFAELERANRAKNAFLAGVSHELKTPLHAVIGFARVLLKKSHGDLNPRQAEYLEYILKNGEHLLAMINDTLDLSRIESGKVDLVRSEINLSQLVADVVQSLQPLADRKSQRLSALAGAELPGVSAAAGKVRQILFNLLSNAIKFSPEQTEIQVQTRPNEFGDEVVVSVTDHGIGIAREDQERIFDPFVRLPAPVPTEGTGLGLSLARRLAELHGGRLWVESLPGSGSTFSFSLPVAGFDASESHRDIVKAR